MYIYVLLIYNKLYVSILKLTKQHLIINKFLLYKCIVYDII